MYVLHNTVACSRNNCCSGKGTMHSVCVELRVTVKYIKILSVAQQCFYGRFNLPATVKST